MLLDARARTGESAILTAVYRGQQAIVNLLVSRGECVATQCQRSSTFPYRSTPDTPVAGMCGIASVSLVSA